VQLLAAVPDCVQLPASGIRARLEVQVDASEVTLQSLPRPTSRRPVAAAIKGSTAADALSAAKPKDDVECSDGG
jgi:hypothetical protein